MYKRKNIQKYHLFCLVIILIQMLYFSNPALVSSSVTGNFGASGNTLGVDTLRVLTYNIQHGRGLDDKVDLLRIADLIKEKNPHIVTLQEVDVGVERSGNIDIMKVLSGYLGMEPVFYKNISHEGGEYGNGLLTSMPLLSKKNLHLIQPSGGEQRGLLTTEIDFNGVRITLMATHLDNRNEPNRLKGVDQIIEGKVAYRGSPIIVTGDFNDFPGSAMHDRMKESYFDVWEEVGEGDGYTIPSIDSHRRIDYFFYTNQLVEDGEPKVSPVHMEVIESEASDHLPIYAEFEIIR